MKHVFSDIFTEPKLPSSSIETPTEEGDDEDQFDPADRPPDEALVYISTVENEK
jgi:hypothetical protein